MHHHNKEDWKGNETIDHVLKMMINEDTEPRKSTASSLAVEHENVDSNNSLTIVTWTTCKCDRTRI